MLIIKTAATDVGDVTISTYGTPANNQPWPVTPTNVTNLWSDIAMHNNPDNRHFTVDRFWEVDATTPVAVDTLKFGYLSVELPDSDANALNLGAQFWNNSISYWNRTQYGIPSAYSVAVPGFNIYNTAWTLTSLISPLPIELLSFEAIPEEKHVNLHWATASETNNSFFTVEKSVNATDFYEIGRIRGAGNSTTIKEYTLDDGNPVYGISYYRLKQTDFDGMTSYSDVVPVNYKKAISHYSLFPNPAHENTYLLSDVEGESIVTIKDVEGKEVKSFIIKGKQINTLDIAGLVQGMYFIEVRSEYETQNLRLIKK